MSLSRALSRGMTGADVKAAKDRLVELGYLHKSTHDTFGNDTRAAVRAFQAASGLAPDGTIGEQTWAALFGAAAPAPRAEPSQKALAACEWALTRIGDVYVWGGNDMTDLSDAKIRARDDESGAARSIRFRDRQRGYGFTELRGYDCSGFVSTAYREAGAWDTRRDCDNLWALCKEVGRAELIPGDLLFRVSASNASDETHVGLYIDGGRVVHAKGRDAGVVLEGIDQNGASWWHKAGRFTPACA